MRCANAEKPPSDPQRRLFWLRIVVTVYSTHAHRRGTRLNGFGGDRQGAAKQGRPKSGSQRTRRWRKPDSNSQSHLNEKPLPKALDRFRRPSLRAPWEWDVKRRLRGVEFPVAVFDAADALVPGN
ncbi:MAG TPA: hypothetical protein VNZ53_03595, partial [Steroidobacteraceae bacterium]|nr:hypothetical protein [Steroidobacteraceae bacterium]